MSARVLLVGGTGVISTPLVPLLAEAGHRVTVMNRGETAQRLPERALPAGVREVRVDRNDAVAFTAAVAAEGPFDTVIDMITFTPEQAQVLVGAAQGQCDQLIFCSTVDVYDKPPQSYPILDSAPRGGRGKYATDKTACEQLLEAAAGEGAFQLTVLRPAHTYCDQGAMLHSLGFGTGWLDRLRRGMPVVVHGDGQSLWASCRAEDVAAGFVGAVGNPRAYGRGYSLASDELMTWRDITVRSARLMGGPEPEMLMIPTATLVRMSPELGGIASVNFQFNNWFDLGPARQDLGFAPRIPWEVGMARTARWLIDHEAIEDADRDPRYNDLIRAWRRAEASLTETPI